MKDHSYKDITAPYREKLNKETRTAVSILLVALVVQLFFLPSLAVSVLLIVLIGALVGFKLVSEWRIKKGYFGNNETEARILIETIREKYE